MLDFCQIYGIVVVDAAEEPEQDKAMTAESRIRQRVLNRGGRVTVARVVVGRDRGNLSMDVTFQQASGPQVRLRG
jgi:hypothetical protein